MNGDTDAGGRGSGRGGSAARGGGGRCRRFRGAAVRDQRRFIFCKRRLRRRKVCALQRKLGEGSTDVALRGVQGAQGCGEVGALEGEQALEFGDLGG